MLIKRCLDIVLSFAGLMILSPVLVVIALLIRLTSKGPVIFKQERIGKDGQPFFIYKFRSMRVDTEAERKFDFSKDADRVTAIGKFIRRTKLDECPQIVNVLTGDMSIVGPRPTVQTVVAQYTEDERGRLCVRPGLTGLAQTNGNIHLSREEKIHYDMAYIENWSLWLDIKIIFKTIAVMICGERQFLKNRAGEGK